MAGECCNKEECFCCHAPADNNSGTIKGTILVGRNLKKKSSCLLPQENLVIGQLLRYFYTELTLVILEQIPCRTAMRGSFPLNGTYFQVNEVRISDYFSFFPRWICLWMLACCYEAKANGNVFAQVFADDESSRHPIDVPRNWIWNLRRRMAYFGTSTSTIFRGD